jgi:hypothetical protein
MQKSQKNFLPALILTIVFSSLFILTIIFLSPDGFLKFLSFYITLFLSSFFLFSLIFANSRRGFLISLFLLIFLLSKQFKIANLLNIILSLAIFVSLEAYFSLSNNKKLKKREENGIV